MEIEIVKLTMLDIDDFSTLLTIFRENFDGEPFSRPATSHLRSLLANPGFLVFVARANKKVAGGLTVHVLNSYYSERPSAYIYDIAVTKGFQRKGIGKLLISTLSSYCEKHGFNEAFVQAEADDTQAVNFYRTTPITHEMKVIHFTYSF